ncbi:MAG: signal peptidase II [Micrococcales bacterium]|nr:signal peptidase II [Micrococcales bacterium]
MQEEGRAPLSAATAPIPPARRRRLLTLLGAIALAVLLADQATKAWALAALTPGQPRDLLGSGIRLNLIFNSGAAFSLGNGATLVLTCIAVGVLLVILATARRIGSRGWAWGLGLMLGGSLGNLGDRFFRAPGPGRGHVVDFIDYFGWFIGNVADIAIVVAAGLIGVLAFRGVGVDGTRERASSQEESAHA